MRARNSQNEEREEKKKNKKENNIEIRNSEWVEIRNAPQCFSYNSGTKNLLHSSL